MVAIKPDFLKSNVKPEVTQAILKEVGIERNEKIILFVGRVSPEKGVHTLIEAMKLVLKQQNCVLLIVGPFWVHPPNPLWLNNCSSERMKNIEAIKDDYQGHLEDLADSIKERVKFVGSKPHYELVNYYELCDIFVHPSLWDEPFGMVVTEAMSCECPVISTYTGAIPEIVVQGTTGLLVKPDEPQALAGAILQLLSNENLRKKMGKEGRKRVEQEFSWDKTYKVFADILNDVGKQARQEA